MSIPTPYIGHLTEDDYEHIYEPAEDSFILLDALERDADELRELKPALCIEIGSGSGVVSTFLGKMLGTSALIVSTDINPHANQATTRTAAQNSVLVEVILANLLDPLVDRMKGEIDILLFNPPYVPTSGEEMSASQVDRDVAGAWAGGSSGMGITNIVLGLLPSVLSPQGRFYLVAVEPNNPNGIIKDMMGLGLRGEIVLRRRAGRELLSVIRITR